MEEMDFGEIEQLVARGESATLELKQSTGELRKGMETACAFLNSEGGWLLFGVTPGMKIIGQKVTDKTRQEVAYHLRKMDPVVEVEAEYVEVPGRPGHYVIALHFDTTQCTNSPYCYDGRPFYKVESTTVTMPRILYEEKLRRSNPQRFSWENTPANGIGPDDLDMELVHQTLYDGIASHRIPALTMVVQDSVKILRKLGVAGDDGTLYNAALVLFGKDPAMRYPQCKVRLARFEGTDKVAIRDQTICAKNLFEQYNAVVDFCLKHLNLSGHVDGAFRKDTLTVPLNVIREAAVNMICHRSWDARNMTPTVAIYEDRIVFQNPGAFPSGTRWQDFADNRLNSRPPNPTIADVFYSRGIIESWGRGIGLIMEECREKGLPPPHYETLASSVSLTIQFPVHLGYLRSSSRLVAREESKNVQRIKKSILDFCKTPRSVTEILEMLQMKDKKWLRQHYLLPLLHSGNLELTIPERPNNRQQKYRTKKAADSPPVIPPSHPPQSSRVLRTTTALGRSETKGRDRQAR